MDVVTCAVAKEHTESAGTRIASFVAPTHLRVSQRSTSHVAGQVKATPITAPIPIT